LARVQLTSKQLRVWGKESLTEKMFSVDEIVSATQGKLVGGKKGHEFSGVCIDSRMVKPGQLFIAIKGDRFDGHDFIPQALEAGASGAILSMRSRHLRFQNKVLIQVEDTLTALQEIARVHRSRFNIPVIAITGSNGKTTTKEMAASILAHQFRLLKNEGNLNNHIGAPLTLLRLEPAHQVAVIEMGINRPGELRRLCQIAQPQVGLITNIGPAHLEFLGNVEGVALAKAELLEALTPEGVAILNADDEYFQFLATKVKGGLMTFSLRSQADVMASAVVLHPDRGPTFRLKIRTGSKPGEIEVSLSTVGKHNIYNALGAAAVGAYMGVDLDVIRQGLEDFKPVSMRSQLMELQGFRVLNDAYNANPASMRSALETLAGLGPSGQKIAVLGDMLELGGPGEVAHREVGREVARAGIQYLITLGSLAEQIAQGALSAGMDDSRVMHSQGPEDAGRMILSVARPGDCILIKGSRKMKMEKILEFIKSSE
jgi:UDP-N-acetylmuramoyl-tripeptide--D-alanyl-D-alanine ligase